MCWSAKVCISFCMYHSGGVCVCVCVSLSLSPSLWKSMFMCPHPLVCVYALVRKTVYECLIRCSLMQTSLPKSTFVSTPNSLCPYFQIFLQDFFYAPPINQTQKKLSKDNFSLIHLYEQCVNSYFQLYRCSAKLAHYETGTLWHSDAYILFTSAKVNGCFISKTIENCLQKQCTMCAAFTDADASFLEWFLSGRSLFPWFLAFLILFVGFVPPLVTESFEFKPPISEDG